MHEIRVGQPPAGDVRSVHHRAGSDSVAQNLLAQLSPERAVTLRIPGQTLQAALSAKVDRCYLAGQPILFRERVRAPRLHSSSLAPVYTGERAE